MKVLRLRLLCHRKHATGNYEEYCRDQWAGAWTRIMPFKKAVSIPFETQETRACDDAWDTKKNG